MKAQSYWQKNPDILGDMVTVEKFYQEPEITQACRIAIEDAILSSGAQSVLDCGCNTGIMGYRLMKRGFSGSYTGCDTNQKALDIGAKLNPKATFVNSDIEDLTEFPDKSFDIVCELGVLEHLLDFRSAVKALSRVAKQMLILDFFIKPLPNQTKIYLHPGGYYENLYDMVELKKLLSSQGFNKITEVFESPRDYVLKVER